MSNNRWDYKGERNEDYDTPTLAEIEFEMRDEKDKTGEEDSTCESCHGTGQGDTPDTRCHKCGSDGSGWSHEKVHRSKKLHRL